jgi:hypothetical protein
MANAKNKYISKHIIICTSRRAVVKNKKRNIGLKLDNMVKWVVSLPCNISAIFVYCTSLFVGSDAVHLAIYPQLFPRSSYFLTLKMETA